MEVIFSDILNAVELHAKNYSENRFDFLKLRIFRGFEQAVSAYALSAQKKKHLNAPCTFLISH